MTESFFIDDDLKNADWLRSTEWDLPIDVDEFLEAIGGLPNLPHFMTLPAAKAMPPSLLAEVNKLR